METSNHLTESWSQPWQSVLSSQLWRLEHLYWICLLYTSRMNPDGVFDAQMGGAVVSGGMNTLLSFGMTKLGQRMLGQGMRDVYKRQIDNHVRFS